MKTKRLYEFGQFRIDCEEAVLYSKGKPVYLKPKVFEMLVVMVENHGRILSKEMLMQRLWQDTFVEEANLAVNVSQLRKALGQSESSEQFIETLPKRGYRFNAAVREVWAEEAAMVVKEYTSSRITIEEQETGDEQAYKSPSNVGVASAPLNIKASIRKLVGLPTKRLMFFFATIVGIAAAGLWFYSHYTNLKWARASVVRIEELSGEEKYVEAYSLALEVRKYLPNDPALMRLMPVISDNLSVVSEPAGAQVYLKHFTRTESGQMLPRQLIGTTPITELQIARDDYILEIEKNGYAPFRRSISSALDRVQNAILDPSSIHHEVKAIKTKSGESKIVLDSHAPIQIQAKLITDSDSPKRMTFVLGGKYRLVSYGKPTEVDVQLDDYFIDQFEVSNQEYKEFINAGGYLKQQFWKLPFHKDGKTLSWQDAMLQFKDRTGLPGPRSWSNQNFPEGKADYPVTDITWYEAVAYAEFRGKQLPTVYQWEKAARDGMYTLFYYFVMPWGINFVRDRLDERANFLGMGTVPVDSLEFGMSPYGCYNMAGNVAEWCRNPQEEGYATAGGSWKDPHYIADSFGSFPGFYCTNTLGFRCVFNASQETTDQGAMALNPAAEILTYKPTSDSEFQAMLRHFQYDQTPLDPEIVDVKETEAWRREKITYNGAGNDRALAYLYLPKNSRRPVQVIHYIPTDGVFYGFTVTEEVEAHAAPYIKAGRAVFVVVLKGYRERPWSSDYTPPQENSVKFREMVVNWALDHRRGLDYLSTRDEIDSSKIACYGVSVNPGKLTLIAVENRYASVILMGAGLLKSWAGVIDEANGANFAPHIRPPKLMIQGHYDEAVSFKTEAEPLFKLLREPKQLQVLEQGHIPPLEVSVPIINEWLDKTMGVVKY